MINYSIDDILQAIPLKSGEGHIDAIFQTKYNLRQPRPRPQFKKIYMLDNRQSFVSILYVSPAASRVEKIALWQFSQICNTNEIFCT